MTWSQDGPDCSAIFRKIAKACVHAVRTNRQRAVGGDPDAVHTMRIGLTKLRAATLFFEPWISAAEWQLLDKELDWLNSALGKARNLDVTIEYSKRRRYRHWAAQSRRKLLRSHDKVHRQLVRKLCSARYNGLMLELDRLLGKRRSPKDSEAAPLEGVSTFCEKRLRTWRDELSRQGRHVCTFGAKRQHRLRIQSKNYRYAVESLLRLNIPLSLEDFSYCEIAKQVHKALGDLRDLRRLRRSIGSRPPQYRKHRRKLERRIERLLH
ncbi:MAG: CHAD domain-containing protein [Bradyrhizobium sp.]|nr:CHAD domain-containing protein [Bradyrhizobium sp.]